MRFLYMCICVMMNSFIRLWFSLVLFLVLGILHLLLVSIFLILGIIINVTFLMDSIMNEPLGCSMCLPLLSILILTHLLICFKLRLFLLFQRSVTFRAFFLLIFYLFLLNLLFFDIWLSLYFLFFVINILFYFCVFFIFISLLFLFTFSVRWLSLGPFP